MNNSKQKNKDDVQASWETTARMLEQTGALAKVGGWELDLITLKLYWTLETCRIHELEIMEAPSLENAINFYAPEAQPIITKAVQEATAFGTPWDLELPLITAKGRSIWVRAQGTAVMENGKAIKLFGAFKDITDRKKTEAELRKLNERLSLVTRVGGVGIWDYNIVENILTWDDQMFVLYGVGRDQFLGAYEAWKNCLHPDDLVTSEKELQMAIVGEKDFNTEFRVIWEDGTVRNIRAMGIVSLNEKGEPFRMVGTNWDITDNRKSLSDLRKSEASIRAFMDAVPEPALLVDKECVVIVANQSLAHSIKKSVFEIVGKKIFEFLPPDVAAHRQHLVNQVVRTGVFIRFEDSNQGRHFVTFLSPVKETDGTVSRIAIFALDITERKNAEKKLQTSLKEKVALLNEVHHRVKNNLQVITSLLRLESGRSNNIEIKTVLSDMQGRIRSMALLHESLYRSGAFAAVDLGAYIKQIATQAFRTFVNHNAGVRLQIDVDAVQIGMDQATPCGLLINELVSNCFKHGFPDGQGGLVHIVLKVLPDSKQVELSVMDTGVGLPSDFENRRNHSLGLQLVGDLTKQIGGSLTKSQNAGQSLGVQFMVIFKVEEMNTIQGIAE